MPQIKPAIIHIDGCDKVGKDTIRDLLVKKSKGSYLVIVRSFISQLAYNLIYQRKAECVDFFWDRFIDADVNSREFFVHVVADKNVVSKRFIKHNEQDLDIEDYESHRFYFSSIVDNARRLGIKILEIDTTNATPEETVREIIDHVQLGY